MDPLYNAASPEEERRAADAERAQKRANHDTLRKIMHNRDGRLWLYRLLERCNIYGSSFEPGQPDVTAFRLGQENIGRQLMVDAMEASSELYIRMVKEQREDEQRLTKLRAADERARNSADQDAVGAHMIDLPPPEGWEG